MTQIHSDIQNREDVVLLIDSFYSQVIKDEIIGEFFTEIMPLDFEHHLPIMYDFWESILLGKSNYSGNPMQKHIQLNDLKKLEPLHFDKWIEIWTHTIQTHFSGQKSEEAISRATQIGKMIQFKIANLSQ